MIKVCRYVTAHRRDSGCKGQHVYFSLGTRKHVIRWRWCFWTCDNGSRTSARILRGMTDHYTAGHDRPLHCGARQTTTLRGKTDHYTAGHDRPLYCRARQTTMLRANWVCSQPHPVCTPPHRSSHAPVFRVSCATLRHGGPCFVCSTAPWGRINNGNVSRPSLTPVRLEDGFLRQC